MKIGVYIAVIFFLVLLFNLNCTTNSTYTPQQNIKLDLEQIVARGKLIAITQNNSTDYFIYKGEPMGYQFEMLKNLAESLNVKLEIIVSNNIDEIFEKLQNKECDIIALNLTKTKERNKIINFSKPFIQTRQVLVQRKPDNWYEMPKNELDKLLIRNLTTLGNKDVYIQENSSFKERLDNLSNEIGDTIHIVELENIETEEIISMVARGEIQYAICDENVALVNQTYYPNLDIKTAISFHQNIAWGVRKESTVLLLNINEWIDDFKNSKQHKAIYNKYFKNNKSVNIKRSEYFASLTGKVSDYDNVIKKHSEWLNWDWKLLASLIYQESKFNTNARSWSGAFGIMQLMPITAERFGIDSLASPEENIEAGVKFIKWIEDQFSYIENDYERTKFVLASYNVGPGHVFDAQRLAKKNGKDPNVWEDNVDLYMLKKSEPKYYQDPVVKHGYCRGKEPFNYVSEVLDRYEHYKNMISE
jgi:membrane-bound lytic murein transglycosylase F